MDQTLKNKIILIIGGYLISVLFGSTFFLLFLFSPYFLPSVDFYYYFGLFALLVLSFLSYYIVIYLAIRKFNLNTTKHILSVIIPIIIIQIIASLFLVLISDNSTFDTPKTIDVFANVVSMIIGIIIALVPTFISIKILKRKKN